LPSPDELTPIRYPGLRPPPDWPAATVAIVRILSANAMALALALSGMLDPRVAVAVASAGMVPGLVRLIRRSRSVRLGEPPRSDGGHLLPPR
jgi:hypothetical protein